MSMVKLLTPPLFSRVLALIAVCTGSGIYFSGPAMILSMNSERRKTTTNIATHTYIGMLKLLPHVTNCQPFTQLLHK